MRYWEHSFGKTLRGNEDPKNPQGTPGATGNEDPRESWGIQGDPQGSCGSSGFPKDPKDPKGPQGTSRDPKGPRGPQAPPGGPRGFCVGIPGGLVGWGGLPGAIF